MQPKMCIVKMRKSDGLKQKFWQGKRRAALLGRRAVSSMPSQWVARSFLLGLPSNTYSMDDNLVRTPLFRAPSTSQGPKTPEQDDLGFGAKSGCTCCKSAKRQVRAAVPESCTSIVLWHDPGTVQQKTRMLCGKPARGKGDCFLNSQ